MYSPPYPDFSCLPPGHPEYRCSQQTFLPLRVGAGHSGSPEQEMEINLFATSENRKCHLFCSTGEVWITNPWGTHSFYCRSRVCSMPFPQCPYSKGAEQDQSRQGQSYPRSTYLAKTSLIHLLVSTLCPNINQAPHHSSFPVLGCRLCSLPQPSCSTAQDIVPGSFLETEVSCFTEVQRDEDTFSQVIGNI